LIFEAHYRNDTEMILTNDDWQYIYIYIYILEVKIYDFDRFYDLNSDMVDILQYKLYLYISLFY
jgi:hypothetical protein